MKKILLSIALLFTTTLFAFSESKIYDNLPGEWTNKQTKEYYSFLANGTGFYISEIGNTSEMNWLFNNDEITLTIHGIKNTYKVIEVSSDQI